MTDRSDHGPYPHPETGECDEFCPHVWPDHGPYAHARTGECTDLCSDEVYSQAAANAIAIWDKKERARWQQRPKEGSAAVRVELCGACGGLGFRTRAEKADPVTTLESLGDAMDDPGPEGGGSIRG